MALGAILTSFTILLVFRLFCAGHGIAEEKA